VNDIGDDPDFDRPPTWGICRPQVRAKWIRKGSQIVFVGFDKGPTSYFLRGRFQVEETITYLDALKRFPTRKNVIIRHANALPVVKIVDAKWKIPEIRNAVSTDHVPQCLLAISTNDGRFLVQNPKDTHEVDNWKCQRIFLCNKNQIQEWIKDNKCQKEEEFSKKRGYVVFGAYRDYLAEGAHIPWDMVAPENMRTLSTTKGQHNARKISNEDLNQLRRSVEDYIVKQGAQRQ